jgi:hypothetical protein
VRVCVGLAVVNPELTENGSKILPVSRNSIPLLQYCVRIESGKVPGRGSPFTSKNSSNVMVSAWMVMLTQCCPVKIFKKRVKH